MRIRFSHSDEIPESVMMVLQSCNLAKNEVTTTSNFEESARSILSAEDSKLARFDKTSYEYEHVMT